MNEFDIVRRNIFCREHRQPDCSPLLNGCSQVNVAFAALDRIEQREQRLRRALEMIVLEGDQDAADMARQALEEQP